MCFIIVLETSIVMSDFCFIASSECLPIDDSSSPGGCPPPADEAGIADTGLKQAALELQRIDEFGRDAGVDEAVCTYG